MNNPQRDDTSPLTGVEHLTAALAVQDTYFRNRRIWDALAATENDATRAIINTVVARMLTPRRDLERTELEQLYRTQFSTALEIFRAFHRGVAGAPHTLAALAKGTPSPVHGTERSTLVASLRRRIIADGYDIDEADARKVLYTVADLVRDVLAAPLDVPAPAARLAPVAAADGPVGDHDEVDWRTGEPKVDVDAAVRAARLAVLAAADPLATAVAA